MKKLIIGIALFLTCSQAFAFSGSSRNENVFNAQTINGTGTTVVSRTFRQGSTQKMGAWLKLSFNPSNAFYSGSNVQISVQGSWDDVAADFATASTLSYAANSAVTASTIATITFPNMNFVRFRATGLTGQSTDSTLTMYLYTQE